MLNLPRETTPDHANVARQLASRPRTVFTIARNCCPPVRGPVSATAALKDGHRIHRNRVPIIAVMSVV